MAAGLCAAAASVVFGAAAFGATEPYEVYVGEFKEYQGIEYICTGIGLESRQQPRWQKYPLILQFVDGNGRYLSDVDIDIVEAGSGKPVFEAKCEIEPWLVVDLQPGRYDVTVVTGGEYRQSVPIQVTPKHQEVILRFPIPEK